MKTESHWIAQAHAHLHALCVDIDNRRVGSSGNRKSTRYFAETISGFGFDVQDMSFECIDWRSGDVHLEAGTQSYTAFGSPYSLGCDVRAPLTLASTEDELDSIPPGPQILLIRGELAREQLMPKNFPFYNPMRHQRIVRLLEKKQPSAIVAATTIDPGLAGGISPFPLIEDGDFDIPSVYMTAEEGERLAKKAGEQIHLLFHAARIPATGSNIVARQAAPEQTQFVVCAHIDAKMGSPGAIDNASGVIVLLLLAEMLQGASSNLGLEIVAFNGEDYFAAPGQIEYLAQTSARLPKIRLAINLDGPGFVEGTSAYSMYECPANLEQTAKNIFSRYAGIEEGEPWVQSDHSIFIQRGVPAMAITSEHFMELSAQVTHTEKDQPNLLDPMKLVEIGQALCEVLLALDQR